ncbi:MAG: DUF1659 domain-containing protein [bacterium]|nr:DUF1659 domain-containing protein [bacterium]
MSAIREQELSRLRLSLKVGENTDGTPIVRNRTYSKVRNTISDTDILAVALSMGTLFNDALYAISIIEEAKVLPE